MTIAWYDPTNHHVSTDKHDPLFTPLGQLWPLVVKQEWVGLTDEEIKDIVGRNDSGLLRRGYPRKEQPMTDMKELTAYDRYQERQRITEEQHIHRAIQKAVQAEREAIAQSLVRITSVNG